jgi:hypothetical protein
MAKFFQDEMGKVPTIKKFLVLKICNFNVEAMITFKRTFFSTFIECSQEEKVFPEFNISDSGPGIHEKSYVKFSV